jgi:hypothetical protein
MLVSHIGGQHQGPASLRLNRGGDCLERSRVTGRKHDCGARGGKGDRGRRPDPAASAGDDRDPFRQIHPRHHIDQDNVLSKSKFILSL